MATTSRSTIVGLFEDAARAQQAVEELRGAGFGDEDVGFAVRRGEGPAGETDRGERGTNAPEGATAGAVTGGVLGGVLGAAAALLIPGLGPVIAGGILAATLGGAAAGAAAGGLLGALAGLGIPEEEAHFYQREFEAGRAIVTVHADGRHEEVAAILRRHGAYDIRGGAGENIETGEPARIPTGPEADPNAITRTGSTTAYGTETSRSDTGWTDRFGGVSMGERPMQAIGGTGIWTDVSANLREEWERRSDNAGRRWEDVEPGYRYGYELAGDPRYQDRAWSDIEADLQSDYRTWAERHDYRYDDDPNAWDRLKEGIREGWERGRERGKRTV